MSVALPSPPASAENPRVLRPPRLAYIDNLRWSMIVLVVMVHAAVTYSGMGSWYYKEPAAQPGKLALLFFAVYQTHAQAFFMGLLFLIAGYFVPASFDRKGPSRFLADRAYRLGVPTLIYALLVHPFLVAAARDALGLSVSLSPATYLKYVLTLSFLEGTGPMWFTLALLIFSAAYAGARAAGLNAPTPIPRRTPPTHTQVLALVVIMAGGSFLVRLVQPMGSSVMNMQLCFFTQYVLLFPVGCAARRRDWFDALPTSFPTRWLLAALLIGEPLWLAAVGSVARSGDGANLTGGLHWQSAAYCIWESLFCLAACLALLTLYRTRLNRQGRAARFLSDNAFAVYVFHAPVVVALSLALRPWPAAAFVKFVVVSALGLLATLIVAQWLVRKTPWLRRVMAS